MATLEPVRDADAGLLGSDWTPLWKLALPGAVLSGVMLSIGLGASFLGAGAPGAERVALREITLPDGAPLLDAAAALSPDESRIVYVRDDPPRLELMDLASGDTRDLGDISRLWNARGFYWAPDGRAVAFNDRPELGGPGRIELIDVEAGTRRVLMDFPDGLGFVWGWDPSGERLLVYHATTAERDAGRAWLTLVNREGQVQQRWAAGEARGAAGRVSPDGRWLAIARWDHTAATTHGLIVVVPIAALWEEAGLPEDYFVEWANGARIMNPPCADDPPRWNRTSDELLFFAFRDGERELWTIQLEDGEPISDAVPLRAPGSPYVVQGWLADGRVLFCSLLSKWDIAVAEVDLENATLAERPRYLPRWSGRGRDPIWSPGGDEIMFVSRHEDRRGDLYRADPPGRSGSDSLFDRVEVEGSIPRNAVWSSDGRVFYTSLLDGPDGSVDRTQGDVIWAHALLTGERERILPEYAFFGWTRLALDAEARRLLFNVEPLGADTEVAPGVGLLDPGTYIYDLEGGTLEQISADHHHPGAVFSPDGNSVALIQHADVYGMDRPQEVVLVSLRDGTRRTLARAREGWDVWQSLTFSPDGRYVGYVVWDPIPVSMCGASEFWLADVEGGVPRKVQDMDRLLPEYVRFSPNSNEAVIIVNDCDASVRLYEPRL